MFLAYSVLGLRAFLTAVFALASPAAFFAVAGADRAALGFAGTASVEPVSGAAAGAAIGSGFCSALGTGLGASFFTFLAGRCSSAAGAGAAAGWSPFAKTSPL